MSKPSNHSSTIQPWTILSSQYVFEHQWYTLRQDIVQLPDGRVLDDYFVSVRRDVVLILAVTTDLTIPVVQQYKHGAGKVLCELPGGYVDAGEEPGEAIISIIATDEDGDELQYSAHDSQGTNFDVIKIDNNNAEFTFRPHFEAAPYTLTIEVSDGKGGIDSYPINMNFVENHHPVITRGILIENLPGVDSPPGGPYVAGGIYYRISVEAVDPDGDPLTYYWSGGGENGFSDPGVNPTNLITPDTAGTFSIYVNAVDRKGGVAEARSEGLIVE